MKINKSRLSDQYRYWNVVVSSGIKQISGRNINKYELYQTLNINRRFKYHIPEGGHRFNRWCLDFTDKIYWLYKFITSRYQSYNDSNLECSSLFKIHSYIDVTMLGKSSLHLELCYGLWYGWRLLSSIFHWRWSSSTVSLLCLQIFVVFSGGSFCVSPLVLLLPYVFHFILMVSHLSSIRSLSMRCLPFYS